MSRGWKVWVVMASAAAFVALGLGVNSAHDGSRLQEMAALEHDRVTLRVRADSIHQASIAQLMGRLDRERVRVDALVGKVSLVHDSDWWWLLSRELLEAEGLIDWWPGGSQTRPYDGVGVGDAPLVRFADYRVPGDPASNIGDRLLDSVRAAALARQQPDVRFRRTRVLYAGEGTTVSIDDTLVYRDGWVWRPLAVVADGMAWMIESYDEGRAGAGTAHQATILNYTGAGYYLLEARGVPAGSFAVVAMRFALMLNGGD